MDILNRTPLVADRRLAYGADPSQFADLWLPPSNAATPFPLVVFLHGGWWTSAYDLTHASFFCSALRGMGVAVYSVEYRRVGQTGGGWPETFLDVARASDALGSVAREFALDLHHTVVAGHSAGAHLAFWLLGRQHVPAGSPVVGRAFSVTPMAAVSLAGAVDLQLTLELAQGEFAYGAEAVKRLMGGTPEEVPDRYLAGDPGHLLPLNVSQHLIQGDRDAQIPPELPGRWAGKARRIGDAVELTMLENAGHLDLIDPDQRAGREVLRTIHALLGTRGAGPRTAGANAAGRELKAH